MEREIEVGVPEVDGNLGRFLVGRVLAVDAHPNADRLRVCQVDVGEGDARQIVCGAWNFEAGATVAVALPGAFLPIFDQPLDERELRGQASRGMILAEDEVGLGADHAGIMLLSEGPEPGTPLVDVLPIRDQVLDVTPTVNRVDLLSMVGIAREIAALLGGELHPPEPDRPRSRRPRGRRRHRRGLRGLSALHRPGLPGHRHRSVAAVASLPPLPRRHALDLERRRRHELRHARLGQPAPRLRPREARKRAHPRPARPRRARSCGRSTGRSAASTRTTCSSPTASARSRWRRSWAARTARSRTTTTELLLEAANFEPLGILRSSERLALRTAGSNRWEKGVDPYLAEPAAVLASRLLVDLAGSRMTGHVDVQPGCPSGRSCASARSAHRSVIGLEVPPEEQRATLARIRLRGLRELAGDASRPGAHVTSPARSTSSRRSRATPARQHSLHDAAPAPRARAAHEGAAPASRGRGHARGRRPVRGVHVEPRRRRIRAPTPSGCPVR